MGTGKLNAGDNPEMDWHPIQRGVDRPPVASHLTRFVFTLNFTLQPKTNLDRFSEQGTDAGRLDYFYGLLFENKG